MRCVRPPRTLATVPLGWVDILMPEPQGAPSHHGQRRFAVDHLPPSLFFQFVAQCELKQIALMAKRSVMRPP
jgi:hypothetical protein